MEVPRTATSRLVADALGRVHVARRGWQQARESLQDGLQPTRSTSDLHERPTTLDDMRGGESDAEKGAERGRRAQLQAWERKLAADQGLLPLVLVCTHPHL
jgi:uncharacterized protein HemY